MEDTDGAAESVSSLRKEILAFTGVDIQKSANEYKNTYEILQELSEVWDDLDDLTRANILEKLFGKRQANVGAAILQNFEIAERALETAANSAGSAAAENEKYLESIQGHLDQLTASFQTLSSNVLDSELVKFGVDFLKLIVDSLNGIIEVFDAIGLEAVGVAADIMLVATAIDAAFGMKHFKTALTYLNKIRLIIQGVQGSYTTIAGMQAIQGFFGLKLDDKEAEKMFKIVDFIKKNWIIAIPVAIAAAVAAIGAIITKSKSLETQLGKLSEAQNAYNSEVSELENLNEQLEENKKRLKELESIERPSIVEQEEVNRLKTENDLLLEQIELQKEIVRLKKQEQYDAARNLVNETHGERYFSGSKTGTTFGWDYYSQEQGEHYLSEVEKWEAYLENARERAAKGYKVDLSWYESELAERESEYIEWKQAVISAWGEFDGATEEADRAAKGLLEGLINWFTVGVGAENGTKIQSFLSNEAYDKFFDAIRKDADITYQELRAKFGSNSMDMFIDALESAEISFDELVNYLHSENTDVEVDVSFEFDPTEMDTASESIKTLSGELGTLANAFSEQNENGSLAIDTILDIIDAGYAAALSINQETGAITLNAEMVTVLAKAKIAETIASLYETRSTYLSAKAKAEEAVAAAEDARKISELAAAKKELAAVENAISGIDAAINALNHIDLSALERGISGIGDAASGANSKIKDLQSGMETLLSQTISWLKQEYSDAQEAQEKYYDAQIDALEEAKDAAKERWDAEKEAIEDAKDSYNDLIDAQIELLRRQKEADDYAKSRAEKEDAVADIENQLLAIENDDSVEAQKMRLELQEQLKEAKDELEELQSDREYELREQALQDEKDRYNDEIDAKLDAIDKQSEAEEKAYQDRIDRLQKYLDAVKDAEKTEAQWRAEAYDWIENRESELYQHLVEWNNIYGDGRQSTVDQWFAEAEGWRAWGETFAEARENIAKYIYELGEFIGAIGEAIFTEEEIVLMKMDSLLSELEAACDKAMEKGSIRLAKSAGDTLKLLKLLSENGVEFTDEMIEGMRSALASGDADWLDMTRNVLLRLYEIGDESSIEFQELYNAFHEAMVYMNDAQFTVLSQMLNNVETVTSSIKQMNRELINAGNGEVKVAYTNPNGIVTRENTSFSEGGVVDYTGPAAVHGSRSNPEVVFNAEAAAKLYDYVVNTPDLLKSAFAGIVADSSVLNGASQINNASSVGDININISGNADADTVLKFKQLAGTIRDEVVKSLNDSMNRRGITRSPRTI